MLGATPARPDSPEEPEADVFPLRERLRFRENFGLGLRDVRLRPAFAALARGPWHVFIAIACYWQSNAEAWPSQETIATFSGYTSRAVRDHVDELEQLGVVRLRRERRPNGAERIYYAPGSVTLTELAAFVERYPRGPAKAPLSHPPEAVSAAPPDPPELASGTPPEAVSGEPRDQDQEPSSSCASEPQPRAQSGEEEQPSAIPKSQDEHPTVTPLDRELARVALAERMKRKNPKRPPPRWFDRADVEMVAVCAAAVDGDRDAKLRALRDSIAGAFAASKEGAPTSRFIWGKLEFFLENVERGRRMATADECSNRLRAEQGRPATAGVRDGRAGPGGAGRAHGPSREDLAKTRAEFEELAATVAPEFRKHAESMAARYRELERRAM